ANMDDYDAWVQKDVDGIAAFGLDPGAPGTRRFADIYTAGGGTLGLSQDMAARAALWVAGRPGVLLDDRTTATLSTSAYRHGLLFKLSGLTHDAVPRYYFGALLATSGLPDRPRAPAAM